MKSPDDFYWSQARSCSIIVLLSENWSHQTGRHLEAAQFVVLTTDKIKKCSKVPRAKPDGQERDKVCSHNIDYIQVNIVFQPENE